MWRDGADRSLTAGSGHVTFGRRSSPHAAARHQRVEDQDKPIAVGRDPAATHVSGLGGGELRPAPGPAPVEIQSILGSTPKPDAVTNLRQRHNILQRRSDVGGPPAVSTSPDADGNKVPTNTGGWAGRETARGEGRTRTGAQRSAVSTEGGRGGTLHAMLTVQACVACRRSHVASGHDSAASHSARRVPGTSQCDSAGRRPWDGLSGNTSASSGHEARARIVGPLGHARGLRSSSSGESHRRPRAAMREAAGWLRSVRGSGRLHVRVRWFIPSRRSPVPPETESRTKASAIRTNVGIAAGRVSRRRADGFGGGSFGKQPGLDSFI